MLSAGGLKLSFEAGGLRFRFMVSQRLGQPEIDFKGESCLLFCEFLIDDNL